MWSTSEDDVSDTRRGCTFPGRTVPSRSVVRMDGWKPKNSSQSEENRDASFCSEWSGRPETTILRDRREMALNSECTAERTAVLVSGGSVLLEGA